MNFRELYMSLGIDPFRYTTIASVCMALYRGKYLEDNKIAVVNPILTQNHSKISIEWLKHMETEDKCSIKHALNGGEERICNRLVVGYCEESKTVYQFHGCYYHGCKKCYKEYNKNTKNGMKMNALYKNTIEFENILRKAKYNVKTVWECEYKSLKKSENIADIEYVGALNPRDSFFGGRTNSTKLIYEFQENEKGYYVDFTSLYPKVNYYGEYPVGHPEIIKEDFKNIDEYFGFVKCKVLAPRGLYHPVLPVRMNNKLLFMLCKKCASKNQSKCSHSNVEREFIGTWATIEIQKAVEMGYKIQEIYKVQHFNVKSNNLFKGYMATFLKIKQEASGFPEWVESEEDKQKYIKNYKEKQGIELEYKNIKYTAGLRYIAKLCLNSLWGKFGENTNKSKTEFITDPAKFYKVFFDDKIDGKILNVNFINENCCEITYKMKDVAEKADFKTNIYIASYTTAMARLKLYEELLEPLNERVLYMDTDSCIYVDRPHHCKSCSWKNHYSKLNGNLYGRTCGNCGFYKPEIGDYLGDLTYEIEGSDYINGVFLGAGPKNYSYTTKNNKGTTKVKGFNLKNDMLKNVINHRNMECVIRGNLPEIRNKSDYDNTPYILIKGSKSKIEIREQNIVRENKTLLNKTLSKTYQYCYDKRVVLENYDTVPYGY